MTDNPSGRGDAAAGSADRVDAAGVEPGRPADESAVMSAADPTGPATNASAGPRSETNGTSARPGSAEDGRSDVRAAASPDAAPDSGAEAGAGPVRRTTVAASAATLAAKRAAKARATAEAQGAAQKAPEPQSPSDGAPADGRSGVPAGADASPATSAGAAAAAQEARRTDQARPSAEAQETVRDQGRPSGDLNSSTDPQTLPSRRRPTSAPPGAAAPQPSMLPPIQQEPSPAGAMQARPAADEARFAATAQAFAGAQAARARAAEQAESAAGHGDAQEQRAGTPSSAASVPPSAQRPAPGRSNVKDRDRNGQPPVDPRLSGSVPAATAAGAAMPADGGVGQGHEALSAESTPPVEQPAGAAHDGPAEREPATEQPAAAAPEASAEPAEPVAAEQSTPQEMPAAEPVRAEAAPAAAPEPEPARPRPEPGVRAAGIYTAPGRGPADAPTQALGAGDAPTLPGSPVPQAVLAAAPDAGGDQYPSGPAPGGASRRQQRSFGQATTAAMLDSPKRGNAGGGDGDDGIGDDGIGDGSGSGGRSKARVAALVAAGVVVVLGVGYGIAYAVAGGSLARGATVAGIEVGGMTREEAETTLEERLPALVDQPFHLTTGEDGTSFEVLPSAAGMTVDVPATIDEIPGGSANPVSLFQALLGGGETAPVPSIDRAALEATLTDIAAQADVEPVNGAVAFDGGQVVTSEPQPGRAVNLDATIERLEGAFFGAEPRLPIGDVALAIDEVQPAVSAEEVQRAVDEFAEPAMSAPVTVVAGEESVELPPELIGQALTMAPDDAGTLQPALDGAKLTDVARDLLAEVGQEGRDATITIEGGEPVVVPAERGMGIAPDNLSAALLPVLTAEGDARQAAVELAEVDPELTTVAAEELGVTEVVAEFTTRFPHAEYRNVNIGTAAERIDNTLLLPGEEFSLNGIVGERTEANGFTAGTIINGGRLEESLGGGVSQVATTTFHAAFLAGLEDVEHWPHSIYFDRYPVGQEATVAWGAKDMRFRNDTPYGVVVDANFSASTPGNQGTLNVKIWSTEYYRVETSVSDRSNFTSPQTIYDTSGNCQAQGGSQGFDVTSYRQVWDLEGNLVKDEADPWTYNPNHRVICGPDPGEDDN